jgi:teichuronic acid exporter
MSSELKRKTVSALSWSFVQEFAQRGLQFGIGVALARLLSPEEFGVVALITVFIVIAQVLVDSGFGSALVQRKDITREDESSVFYFNIALGILLGALLCLAAPAVATFYEIPELSPLLRVLSIILVLNAFAVVQSALMVRRLDFRRQAIISIASTIASGTVGIVMAWRGFGVWSLVAQQIANSATRSGMYWILNTWQPVWTFQWKSLRSLLRFGSGMTASVLLNTAFENLYPLVIGKLFPAAQLGLYNRAQTLQAVASQTLSTAANRVTFPVFSRLQDDPVRLRNGLRRAMRTMVFVQFPMMIGLAAVAEPVVLLLLTDKWAGAIPFLQVLCFVGLFHPIHMLNVNILMASGRTDLLFRLELIKRTLLLVTLVVTARWGIMAIIWGQVALTIACLFVNTHYTKRLVQYSFIEQLRDFSPYLALASAMGLSLFLLNLSSIGSPLAVLLIKISIGAAIYAGLSFTFRLAAVAEFTGMIRRKNALAAS